MKIKDSFIIAILLLLSCNQQQQQTTNKGFNPQVVKANGHVVPKDSMATPVPVPAGKPEAVEPGKPIMVPVKSNIHLAGMPKTIVAGAPKVCTPGKDSFSIPKTVRASIRTFIPGIPEMVIAKDGFSKEQNAQNFISFNKLEGLIKGKTVSLLQDRNGNLWIGSWEGGVVRYDGKYFTRFTQKEGLPSNEVWSLLEDRAGNIWFGTVGGATKYDGKTFTNYTENGLLGYVSGIIEDRSGNIWFACDAPASNSSEGGGAWKLHGDSLTHYTEKEGLYYSLSSVFQDKYGDLWFGTFGGGLIRYDNKSFSHFTRENGLDVDGSGDFLEDRYGNLWFGSNNGVIKYDGKTKTFAHYTTQEGLIDNGVNTVYQDKEGNFWFGTGAGISKFDGTYFTNFDEEDGLINNIIATILEDRSGNLWFGTENGLSRYNGEIFTHFTRKEGLSYNEVLSFFEDKRGTLWISTTAGGITKYDGKAFTRYVESEGFPYLAASYMMEDNTGDLWFGLIRYDGRKLWRYAEKAGLPACEATGITQDRRGNMWMGCRLGGAIKFDGKTFTRYTVKEGLSNNDVWNIFADKVGNIWYIYREGGVTKYDGETFTHYSEKEGLGGNSVSAMAEDSVGNIWFGTEKGLTEYDGTAFTHFTVKEGLSSNSVSSILPDRKGNLWVGTALGLNKLSANSLLKLSAYAKTSADNSANAVDSDNTDSEKVLFKSYTYEDGFLGIGCNGSALFEDRKGTIWVGTNDRVTAYHPEGDKRDSIVPNMQLTSVALFNENIPWQNLDEKKDTAIILGNGVAIKHFQFDSLSRWYNIPQDLSLAYNNNYLTFNFIGITTKSPQKVKYQYRLEGLDDFWSGLTNVTYAAYGNLAPGNYTFRVKAMNSEGYWSKEFNYKFTIRPPWWKTWWAYSLYVIIFLGAVASFIAYRSRKLKRENKLLEEKVSLRTIQLEQKSTELGKSLDDLKSTQAQLIQSEKMASLGELTAGIAHEIQNPLNFVNNFSELNKEMLEELKAEHLKAKSERDDQLQDELISHVLHNSEKINHHGKRADAIVKGMLQHSRSSSGIKEPTDINALCDEYLRLTYHGLRAKDKTFNATIKTDFDNTIDKLNIVPQDIGRVILNLINNAFYAVDEKYKAEGHGYKPTVAVATKKLSGHIEIAVKDNGNGIPQKIIDKIFQPFFTTKPTGQGTGLGLSLAYDIVKAHGGEIKVETKEGEGTEFSIQLPIIANIP